MNSECQFVIVCLKQNEQMEILGMRLRVWCEKHVTSVTNLSWTFFTSEAEIPVKQKHIKRATYGKLYTNNALGRVIMNVFQFWVT